jgi:hypothetical protein
LHLARLEAGLTDLEAAGQAALRVDLADQGPLAALGSQERQSRGDRGLADTPLAGDEQQASVEEVGQDPNPMRRSESGVPIST